MLRGLVFKPLNIRKTTSKRDSLCSDNASHGFRAGAESLYVLLCLGLFSLQVVAASTGWMVDRAFKELSTSCTSSSSSPAKQPACLPACLPTSRVSCLCPVFLAKSNKKRCKKRASLHQVASTTGKIFKATACREADTCISPPPDV